MQEIISIAKCTAIIIVPIASIFTGIGVVAQNLIGIHAIELTSTAIVRMLLMLLTSSGSIVAGIMTCNILLWCNYYCLVSVSQLLHKATLCQNGDGLFSEAQQYLKKAENYDREAEYYKYKATSCFREAIRHAEATMTELRPMQNGPVMLPTGRRQKANGSIFSEIMLATIYVGLNRLLG